MLDANFLQAVSALQSFDLGTEHVALLLYSIVRMIRPQSILEVGLGYTTPFLLQGLADNEDEFEQDKLRLQQYSSTDLRMKVLLADYYENPYNPQFIGIDNYSDDDSTATLVKETIRHLELNKYFTLFEQSFCGLTKEFVKQSIPLFDLVWFDCGGPEEYSNFLEEYWPFVNPEGGMIALHYTYWHPSTIRHRMQGTEMVRSSLEPSSILKEIKRQQALQGTDSNFEVVSLVEPHKYRQGSVTLIRKSPGIACTPDFNMIDELSSFGFRGEISKFKLNK